MKSDAPKDLEIVVVQEKVKHTKIIM